MNFTPPDIDKDINKLSKRKQEIIKELYSIYEYDYLPPSLHRKYYYTNTIEKLITQSDINYKDIIINTNDDKVQVAKLIRYIDNINDKDYFSIIYLNNNYTIENIEHFNLNIIYNKEFYNDSRYRKRNNNSVYTYIYMENKDDKVLDIFAEAIYTNVVNNVFILEDNVFYNLKDLIEIPIHEMYNILSKE